ncbi:MAG: hypothetical protein QM773_11615 [Hyphomonadaceae bacterium]
MARHLYPGLRRGACVTVAALLAPLAGAQTPESKDASCVHDTLKARGVATIVAETYLTDEAPEGELNDARLHLADAVKSCVEERELSESQAAATRDIGLYSVAIDYLADKLAKGGASAAAVAGARAVIGVFSDEDIDRFFEDDWRSDLAFMGKVKAALIARGLPDAEPGLTTAFDMIEIEAKVKQAAFLFKLSAENS